MKKRVFFIFIITFLITFFNHGICKEVIKVSTPRELIYAIGPDRTIELAPGEYNLTEVSQIETDYVEWENVFDGFTMVIKNVENLKIEGAGEEKVLLRVTPNYTYVLAFDNGEDIELVNLEMGHYPEPGYCTGGVVSARHCQGFTINDSILFGCGTEGLTLDGVTSFYFENSVIKDCTYGIMTILASSSIYFEDSEFTNNREYYGIIIERSTDVEFKNCSINNNFSSSTWPGGTLFNITSSVRITVEGGEICDNIFFELVNQKNGIEIIDVKEENNIRQK